LFSNNCFTYTMHKHKLKKNKNHTPWKKVDFFDNVGNTQKEKNIDFVGKKESYEF
jgi:hypothetical protein